MKLQAISATIAVCAAGVRKGYTASLLAKNAVLI
jgi:hypothetical protein